MVEKGRSLNWPLRKVLEHFEIPVLEWDKDHAKSVGDLEEEILLGESRLVLEEDGKLSRHVVSTGVNVWYKKQGNGIYYLEETRQEFSGWWRKREILTSLAEKIRSNEEPDDGARRAVQEELGLPYVQLTPRDTFKTSNPSKSYPGLMSHHIIHRYDLQLTHLQFKPEGYREVGPRKTSVFEWKKADETSEKS